MCDDSLSLESEYLGGLRSTSLLRGELSVCDRGCHYCSGAQNPRPGGAAGRPQAPASVMRAPSHSLCRSFAGTNFGGDTPRSVSAPGWEAMDLRRVGGPPWEADADQPQFRPLSFLWEVGLGYIGP